MSSPYVGEIRLFAGNFAPAGWELCAGQLVPISEYETLFNLIGTTYGGDGQSTFALPDLRGRIPVHQGGGFVIGQAAGVEEVTLIMSQVPAHAHPALASGAAASSKAPGGGLSAVAQGDLYASSFTGAGMSAQSVSATGGSQPHSNLQPFLCVNFIISMYGIFPPQN